MTHPVATTRSAAGMPTGKLAVWWVVVSEIPIFGGLLASYLMHRIGHPEWGGPLSHLDIWIGTANTLVLLASSLAAVLAHAAAARGDGRLAAWRLLMAAGGGLVFLGIKAFEWSGKIAAGLVPAAGGFWSFYFAATGLHAAHVLAGVVILAIVGAGAARNRNLHRVECIGLYWHFVDVVWIVLFHLFYVVR